MIVRTPWLFLSGFIRKVNFFFLLPQIADELHQELSEKKAELRCVQDELSTRDNERASDGSLQSLRNMLMALQKENSDLKVYINVVLCKCSSNAYQLLYIYCVFINNFMPSL
jgi:hypothetical protein